VNSLKSVQQPTLEKYKGRVEEEVGNMLDNMKEPESYPKA
jgi:uncharacterized protein YjbJ (UPF0337 family)